MPKKTVVVVTTDLHEFNLLPIFLVSLVVVLAATELGRWLGERAGDLELSCLPALGVFDQRFNSAG